jgi:hypothetical protein
MKCCKKENFIKISGKKYKCQNCGTTFYKTNDGFINANTVKPFELLDVMS